MAGSYTQHAGHLICLFTPTKELKPMVQKHVDHCLKTQKTLRIFLDVRGSFINVHSDDGKKLLQKFLKKDNRQYAQKILAFVNNWYSFFQSKSIRAEIILFGEIGESTYHNELLPENVMYKGARRKQSIKDTEETVRRDSRIYTNGQLELIDEIFSTTGTNVCSILMKNLEVDCAPHVIIHHNNDEKPGNYRNLIFSKDKDLVQTLDENTFQITKKMRKSYVEVSHKEAAPLMFDKFTHQINHKLLSLALSLVGDTADSIGGLKGIGPMKISPFMFEHGEAILSTEGGDILKQFFNFIETNDFANDKNFLAIKRAIGDTKKKDELIRSFFMVDFDQLITHKKYKSVITEEILNKYNGIIRDYTPSTDHSYLKGKREFIRGYITRKTKVTMLEQYCYIVENTY